MNIQTASQGDVVVIAVSGMLNVVNAAELERVVREQLNQGSRRLVLDLSEVGFAGSAALRAFLLAAKETQARGGAAAFCGLSDNVRKVFDLAGLSLRLEILPTRKEAVEAVNRSTGRS